MPDLDERQQRRVAARRILDLPAVERQAALDAWAAEKAAASRGRPRPTLFGDNSAVRAHVNGGTPPGSVASGIPAWHGRRTLADLADTWQPTPTQQTALQAAAQLVTEQRRINPPPVGLLLIGPPGTGKTSIAAAIAVELGEPRGCAFVGLADLYAAARADDAGEREAPWEAAIRPRVLVLDDLGARRDTEARVDRLRDLLERRYDRCRVLVATANLTVAQLRGLLGERTWSRVSSGVAVVAVDGPDHRRQP